MIKKELLKKWENIPDDAEVRLIIGDAEEYTPIVAGYAPNLNMILIMPEEQARYYEECNPREVSQST